MMRKVIEKDLFTIEKLEQQCFTSPWNHQQFLYELKENPFSNLIVLEQQDEIIGYMDYWITFECCQLNKIAVEPSYRHQGWAKQMMDEIIKKAEKAGCETIMLEVRVSNMEAQQLYQAYEFIEVNRRRGYYPDNGEDAIIMVKALGGN